jgi:AcrR family transcriptional regulator
MTAEIRRPGKWPGPDPSEPEALAPPATPGRLDGRRLRAHASRIRITEAVVRLVGEGNIQPTAEQIAAAAQVSLRTVFRHFDEMENIYLEVAAVIQARAEPVISRPFLATGWPAVLDELIDRRAEVFEIVAPYKRALDVYRARSDALTAANLQIHLLSRTLLLRYLPDAIARDPQRFEAFDLLLGIETWLRLRDLQGLDARGAKAVLRWMGRALSA